MFKNDVTYSKGLTKNCRNTYEIAVTAYNVIGVKLHQKIQMVSGEKTTVSFVKGQMQNKLAKLLKIMIGDKYRYSYSDIVILSLGTEEESVLKTIYKISGIPITRTKSNSSILFTTAKKFKGLESKVVIIVDVEESCFSDERKQRDFYVACSRATHHLSIMIEGDSMKLKNIANIIEGPNFSARGKIAMKTHANILDLD